MRHPLDAARAKVERARHLCGQLCAEVMAFVGDGAPTPYTAKRMRDAATGEVRVTAEATGASAEPPVTLALLAGEIAHQLRSALDHVVYQVFISSNLTPTTKTGFPIFKSQAGLCRPGSLEDRRHFCIGCRKD